MPVAGLLLAAGAGRRFGQPKALVRVRGEPMVRSAFRVLAEGGCAPVCVVVGARADEVRAQLPSEAETVYAPGWDTGMGASLRAGLRHLAALDPAADAAMVHLVDLPDVPRAAIARVRARASPDGVARAYFGGAPGHPVLLGNRWWAEIAGAVTGDHGARDWLRGREDLVAVECGDLATGADVDTPEALNP